MVGEESNQYVVINNDLGLCTPQYSNHLLQIEKERYLSYVFKINTKRYIFDHMNVRYITYAAEMYAAIANALRINVLPQLAMHFPFLCNVAS
jgi:hypothetical protein